jgi:hypothetical protein
MSESGAAAAATPKGGDSEEFKERETPGCCGTLVSIVT